MKLSYAQKEALAFIAANGPVTGTFRPFRVDGAGCDIRKSTYLSLNRKHLLDSEKTGDWTFTSQITELGETAIEGA
jgi:hypothetical protein